MHKKNIARTLKTRMRTLKFPKGCVNVRQREKGKANKYTA